MKNRVVREIGGKITVFDLGEGNDLGYRKVRKIEGSRNRDSTASLSENIKIHWNKVEKIRSTSLLPN